MSMDDIRVENARVSGRKARLMTVEYSKSIMRGILRLRVTIH